MATAVDVHAAGKSEPGLSQSHLNRSGAIDHLGASSAPGSSEKAQVVTHRAGRLCEPSHDKRADRSDAPRAKRPRLSGLCPPTSVSPLACELGDAALY